MNASNPPIAIAMPTTCPPPRSRRAAGTTTRTASAGCTTWAMPIVPIGIVFCANTISPLRGDPGEKRQDQHVGPAGAAHPEHVAVGDSQRQHRDGRDRTDRRHEGRDVHVPAELSRRHDVADQRTWRARRTRCPSDASPFGGALNSTSAEAAERDEANTSARGSCTPRTAWRRAARSGTARASRSTRRWPRCCGSPRRRRRRGSARRTPRGRAPDGHAAW